VVASGACYSDCALGVDAIALSSFRDSLETLLRAAVALGAADLILTEGWKPLVSLPSRSDYLDVPALDRSFMTAYCTVLTMMSDAHGAVLSGKSLDDSAQFHAARVRYNIVGAADDSGRGSRVIITMRLLQSRLPRMADLLFPESLVAAWLNLDRGVVLLCGATGSGKTTSLAGMLVDSQEAKYRRIATLENPIEFRLGSVRIVQSQVGLHFPSFTEGTRSFTRRALQVGVVGECRDSVGLSSTIEVAEQGTLAVTTLHVESLEALPYRVMNLPPTISGLLWRLIERLAVVIVQRLVFVEDLAGNIIRVPVRSYVVLSDKDRKALLSVHADDLARAWVEFVSVKGVSFADDLDRLRSDGHLPMDFKSSFEVADVR